jgi:hypothetical protein
MAREDFPDAPETEGARIRDDRFSRKRAQIERSGRAGSARLFDRNLDLANARLGGGFLSRRAALQARSSGHDQRLPECGGACVALLIGADSIRNYITPDHLSGGKRRKLRHESGGDIRCSRCRCSTKSYDILSARGHRRRHRRAMIDQRIREWREIRICQRPSNRRRRAFLRAAFRSVRY